MNVPRKLSITYVLKVIEIGFNAVGVGFDKEVYEIMLIVYKFGMIQFFYWLEFSLLFKVALVCKIFAFLVYFIKFKNFSCQYIDEKWWNAYYGALISYHCRVISIEGSDCCTCYTLSQVQLYQINIFFFITT